MESTSCSYPSCDKPNRANGLCNAHRMQASNGQPLRPLRVRGGVCAFDGCAAAISARKLCTGHYKQAKRGVPLTELRGSVNREAPCLFPGCSGRVVNTRGYCNGHTHQLRRGVELTPVQEVTRRSASIEDRIASRTDKQPERDGCWLWTGATSASGHARMRDPRVGETRFVYRIVYELEHGPIPDGMEVDHKCRVPSCVRVSHLQLATKAENGENRKGPNKNSTSGVRNVSWCQGAWMVMVQKNGVAHYGGRFQDIGDAEQAAIALRLRVQTNNLIDRE